MIGGLILAGGRSRRFGREKALAEIGGEPMIAWVARALCGATARLAISAPKVSLAAAFAAAHGFDWLGDAPEDVAGPLAGVRAGLRWAEAQGFGALATAPCDTPFLPDDLVRRLGAGGTATPAVARTPRGPQPLCALWPTAILPRLDDLAGHPPMRAVLAQMGAVEVAFEDADAFANLNTVDELRLAEIRFEGDRASRSARWR